MIFDRCHVPSLNDKTTRVLQHNICVCGYICMYICVNINLYIHVYVYMHVKFISYIKMSTNSVNQCFLILI